VYCEIFIEVGYMLLSETGFLFGKNVTGYFKLNDISYCVK